MVIVAARGITGGISIAVWNVCTSAGLIGPPGIASMARCIQPVCVATYQASVEAPVSLRKLRRVGMVPPPNGYRGWLPAASRADSRRRGVTDWTPDPGQPREPPGSFYHPATNPSGVLAPPGVGNRCETTTRQAGSH